MAAPLRWLCTGAANIWQVHHCENHDVSFHGVFVLRRECLPPQSVTSLAFTKEVP
jgi:hypothetical protein